MNYLLDTNVVSESIKPQPDANVIQWLDEADEDHVYLSVITLGEINQGVAKLPKSARRDLLKSWLEDELPLRFEGRLLNVDAPVARSWGEVMAEARRTGYILNPVDGFFVATTLIYDLTLVTRNIRHFAPLDVKLLNPWIARPLDKP